MNRKKKFAAMLLSAVLSAGLLAVPAFASDEQPEAFPFDLLPVEELEEPVPPLTPDGNLTLVDDVGTITEAGKQFVTFVTKNGNYFYLIIDRDDKGKENVHFLNLVDEADLFALLEEEEVQAYKDAQEAAKPDPAPTPVPTPSPEPEAAPKPVKKGFRVNPLLIFALLGIGGAGAGGWFFMQKKKKEAAMAKPDPDANYSEDDGTEYEDVPEDEPEEDIEIEGDELDDEPV